MKQARWASQTDQGTSIKSSLIPPPAHGHKEPVSWINFCWRWLPNKSIWGLHTLHMLLSLPSLAAGLPHRFNTSQGYKQIPVIACASLLGLALLLLDFTTVRLGLPSLQFPCWPGQPPLIFYYPGFLVGNFTRRDNQKAPAEITSFPFSKFPHRATVSSIPAFLNLQLPYSLSSWLLCLQGFSLFFFFTPTDLCISCANSHPNNSEVWFLALLMHWGRGLHCAPCYHMACPSTSNIQRCSLPVGKGWEMDGKVKLLPQIHRT